MKYGFLLFSLLMLSFVSAGEMPPVKQGDLVILRQTCGSCSYVNISVYYPNSTKVVDNQAMTNAGGGYWEYEFSYTSSLGKYDYPTCGDISGVHTCSDSEGLPYFEVSHTGKELTSAKAISYTVIFIISVLIFIGLLWIGLVLPSGNKTDEFTGYVIAIRNLKYLKYVLLGFSYITLLWLSYFSWMITYAYLDFEFLSSIFRLIFTFLAILTLPLFILFVWITITNLIKDSQVGDAIMRGLKVNG